ncbi:MAG: hypothetical protein JO210_19760 [Acidobacteriaceae bacterium]|nr:hypothetical protein [Acidobacteriaceae bacterium]
MLIPRISVIASRFIIICAVLGTGSLGWSQTDSWARSDDEGTCSNRTLHGDYGFTVEGVILAIPGVMLPPGAALPLRGVGIVHLDGRGNLSQVDHVLVNGMPPPAAWTPGSGTYSLNSNCTGTAVINVPGNPLSPLKLHLVVVKDGKEFHTVVEANAVTSTGIKIE